MQRIIIAYNPRSSKHARIQEEVIRPIQKMSGYVIGKYEIKAAPVDENVANLAKLLSDDDFLIVAGGDGTATVGLNAAIRSKANVVLGVLGYGNFNDFARIVKTSNVKQLVSDFKKGRVQKLYPLKAKVDGKIWRYAACYFTIGMFAESTEVFDAPETRKKLRKGKKSFVYSIIQLAKWYFGSRKKEFLLGDIRMNNVRMNLEKVSRKGKIRESSSHQVSDIMFVNGKTVAKIMRGGNYWQSSEDFFVSFGRLKGFFRLCSFMMKSMFGKMPGHVEKQPIKIDFSKEAEFEIQAEGEYMKMKARELVISKSIHGVKVVVSES